MATCWTAGRSARLAIACICLLPAAIAVNTTSIREVGSADELQQALVDGVPHIVLTNHINADSITPGNCTKDPAEDPNVSLIELSEGEPECRGSEEDCHLYVDETSFKNRYGSCVIEVVEDFLEVPVGSKELWLHNLYVVVRQGSPENSSTVLLHADGSVWWTQSVLQGRSALSRGVDVNTKDGGQPRLYLGALKDDGWSEVRIVGMSRDHAPVLRASAGTFVTMGVVSIEDCQIEDAPQGGSKDPATAPATLVSLFDDAILWAKGVYISSFLDYYFSFSSTEPAGKLYGGLHDAWDTAKQEGGPMHPDAQRPTGMPEVASQAFHALHTEQKALAKALHAPPPSAPIEESPLTGSSPASTPSSPPSPTQHPRPPQSPPTPPAPPFMSADYTTGDYSPDYATDDTIEIEDSSFPTDPLPSVADTDSPALGGNQDGSGTDSSPGNGLGGPSPGSSGPGNALGSAHGSTVPGFSRASLEAVSSTDSTKMFQWASVLWSLVATVLVAVMLE